MFIFDINLLLKRYCKAEMKLKHSSGLDDFKGQSGENLKLCCLASQSCTTGVVHNVQTFPLKCKEGKRGLRNKMESILINLNIQFNSDVYKAPKRKFALGATHSVTYMLEQSCIFIYLFFVKNSQFSVS